MDAIKHSDLYGFLVITMFVARYDNPDAGRGVVLAKIRTTYAEAPGVLAQWRKSNSNNVPPGTPYNNPLGFDFQPDRMHVES
jgi:hypothetical protein